MNCQTDMLDYVVDNESNGMREIYRNGVMVANVGRRCVNGARGLKAFNAVGEWGVYPALPVTRTKTIFPLTQGERSV